MVKFECNIEPKEEFCLSFIQHYLFLLFKNKGFFLFKLPQTVFFTKKVIEKENKNLILTSSPFFLYNLLNKAIRGLFFGWICEILIDGIGYKAFAKAGFLKLDLGLSHSVFYKIPSTLKVIVIRNRVFIFGLTLASIYQFVAILKRLRVANAYRFKGFRFETEIPVVKVGKKR